MGIMAVGTGDLALSDGMAGAPEALCPFVDMTGKADLGLGRSGQDRVIHTHRIMTRYACIAARGMAAYVPVHLDIALGAVVFTPFVAGEADGSALFGREVFQGHDKGRFAPRLIHMLAHGAVTGLTAALGQGPAVLAVGKGLHKVLMALKALAAALGIGGTLHFRIKGRPIHLLSRLDQAACELERNESRYDYR